MAGSFQSIFKRKDQSVLTPPEKTKPLMRVLEPRVLLDAAAVETALDIAGQAAHSQLADDYAANSRTVETMSDEASDTHRSVLDAPSIVPDSVAGEAFVTPGETLERRTDREIVFIDAGVADPDVLIASLEPGVQVHILQAGEDGVQQIADVLSSAQDYDAIHIFSHGTAGALQLGNAELNTASIAGEHATALASIGAALSESGDILIYGCDFGQGDAGRLAAQQLSAATGADVAASDDLTGSESLSGDWDLEVHTGQIERQAFSAPNWEGILAGYTLEAQGVPEIGHRDGGVVGTAGTTATWESAVTFDDGIAPPQTFDIRATIVGLTDNASATFETADSDGTGMDDFRIVVTNIGAVDPNNPAPNALEPGSVTVRWEIFEAGTEIIADPQQLDIFLRDVTGNAGLAESGETIIIESDKVTGYVLESGTDLDVGAGGSNIFVSGTTLAANERSQIALAYEDTNRFVITYTSRTLLSEFDMVGNDGAGSFNNPVATDTQFIDLNGTGDGGLNYTAFYANGSAFGSDEDVPLSIVDLDLEIFDADNLEITGATIVLTNAYAGDTLNYDIALINRLGIDLVETITPGAGGLPDTITLELDGFVRISNYLTALQSITYSNPLPDASFNRVDARLVDISITDGIQTSSAQTTIVIATAGNAPVAGNNVYVEDEDMVVTADFANGLIGDDRDRDTADLDVASVTDANGVALVDEIVGGVPTGFLVNPTDPVTGDSLLTNGATLRVSKADGSFTYTPPQFYNGNEVFSYEVTDGTFTTQGFATFDIQPVANDVNFSVVAPDPLTDPGTPEDQASASISVDASSPDAKEQQVYLALDIPNGVILTDGTNSFMATDDEQEVDITGWDRTQIRVLPVQNSDREITIEFLVTNFEVDNSATEASEFVTFKINAVADRPTLIVNEARAGIDEDVNLSLIIQPRLFDVDGSEDLTDITISNIPLGAEIHVNNVPRTITGGVVVLSHIDLQTLVFRPPQNGQIITYDMFVSATATEVAPNGDVVLATATESNVLLRVRLNDETEPVIAVDDNAVTFAGQAVTIDVLSNDSIPDGTPNVTEINGIPIDVPSPVVLPGGEGTVYLTVFNELRFEAAPLFSGEARFTYTVQDIDQDEGTANVTVSVQPRWTLSGDTSVIEDGGGDDANFVITIEGAVQQGQSISTDLVLSNTTADAADHEALATAVNRAIVGPPGYDDFTFDGTRLTYTAPDANYVSNYDVNGSDFIDISVTGTALSLGDEGIQAAALGFDFPLYGDTYSTAYVSANGYITLGSPGAAVDNLPLDGTALGGRPIIAPYWDDLDASTGAVYTDTFIDGDGKEYFIVQWDSVTNKNGGGTGTFQLVMSRSSGEITYNYLDVDFGNAGDNGAQATIGVQSTSGVADEYAFNQPNSVVSGSQILFERGATINPTFNIDLGIVDDGDFELQENFALRLQNSVDSAIGNSVVQVTIEVSDNMAPVASDDIGTINETGILIANLLDPNAGTVGEAGEDSDPEGHTLQLYTVNGILIGSTSTVVPLGGGAALLVNQDGSITYDSNGKYASLTVGQTADEVFTYQVQDQYGAISTVPGTVTITVTGENQGPDIDFDTGTSAIDTAIALDYGPSDTALVLTGATAGIYDPDDTNFNLISIALSGFVQPALEVIHVGGVGIIHGSAARTETVTINLVSFAVVYDGANQLTIQRDGGGEMSTAEVNSVLQALAYENTSTDDTPGIRTFSISANDGDLTGSVSTISVDVIGNNTAPIATNDGDPSPYQILEDTPLDIPIAELLANDFDADVGDFITFDSVNGGFDGTATFDMLSQSVQFTPFADFTGMTSFTYTIRDSKGEPAEGTVFVDVLPINDAPRVDLNGGLTGVDYSFDYDENDPLTRLVPVEALVVDVDNTLLNRMDVVLTNGQPGDRIITGTISGSIIVNVLPPEGSTGLTSAQTLTIRLSGNATPAEYDAALKTLRFENITDAPSEVARVIEISASDGPLSSAVATTTINVTAINDAPVTTPDSGFEVDEDGIFIIDPAILLANDTDLEGDTLSITDLRDPFPGGSVSFNGPGDVVFIPPPDYFGPASFTYIASDGNGGETEGTVNLVVRSVNDLTFIDLDTNTTGQDFATTYVENQTAVPIVDPTFLIADVDDTQMEGATITLNNGRLDDILALTVTSPDISASIVPGVPLANDGPILLQLSGTASVTDYRDVIAGITFEAATEAPNETPRTITIQLNDGVDLSNPTTSTIAVTAVNDAPVAAADTGIAFDEDTFRIITQAELLSNDLDPDLETITLISVQDETNGAVLLNGDGTIRFTPTPNYFGPASFTYTIEDAAGEQSTATVNMMINSINDVAQIDLDINTGGRDFAVTYNEDDAVGVALLDPSAVFDDVDDTDFEGATLSLINGQIGDEIIVGTLPGGINATVVPSGPLTFAQSVTVTLSGSATVADYKAALEAVRFTSVSDAPTLLSSSRTVQILVNDGDSASNTASTIVTIVASNDDPVANPDGFTIDEDSTLQIASAGLIFNDADPDQEPVAVQSVGAAVNGTVSLVGGQIQFVPDANFFGTASFDYTLTDGNGGSGTGTVTVTVNPLNDAPTTDLDTANGASNGFSTAYTEGDAAVPIVGTDVAFVDVDDANLEGLIVTLTNGQVGDLLTVGALAGGITIDGVVPGALLAPGPLTVQLTGTASAADYALAAQAISYSSESNNPSSVNRTLSVTVSDGNLTSLAQVSTIAVTTVNDAPVAGPDGTFTFDEDALFTTTPLALLLNDTDGENEALRVVSVENPTNGTVVFANGVITFTPDADYFGPASFEYTVTDEIDTSTGVVALDVTPVNDAPTLDLDTNVSGTGFSVAFVEDAGAVALVDPSVLVGDADTAQLSGATVFLSNGQIGDVLSVGALPGGITATATPSGPLTVSSPISLELSGAASFADYQAALLAVTYNTTSNDPSELDRSVFVTVNDGLSNSNAAQTTLTVQGVNDAPTVVNDGPFTLDEDIPFTTPAVGLLLNDSDFEGDALTVINVHTPVNGSVTLSSGGIVTFTPDANYFGPASFEYDVRDAVGGVSTGLVELVFTPVNDIATLDLDTNSPGTGFLSSYTENDPATVLSDPSVLIQDVDSPDLAGATFTLTNGRVGDILEVGALGGGITASVVPATALAADGTVVVTLSGAASQADYIAALQAVTFRSISDNPDTTSRTISVSVTDGADTSADVTAIVAITAVNDAPTAVSDGPLSTPEDIALVIPAADLLANDTDPEGDALTLVSVQDGVNGTAVLQGDGSVQFTPDSSYFGPASFTYTVRDTAGLTSTETVNIDVTFVNDAPVLDLNGAANPGADFAVTYDENDPGVQIVDPDVIVFDEDHSVIVDARVVLTNGEAGDILELGLLPGTMSASVFPGPGLSGPGTITVTFSGSASFADYQAALQAVTYRSTSESPSTTPRVLEVDAFDGFDRSTVVTTTITVNSINDAPVASNDGVPAAFVVQEDMPFTFNPVAANDTDVEGDALSITEINGVAIVPGGSAPLVGSGTVALDLDGQTLTFTPAPNFFGSLNFSYTVSDGSLTDVATVNIDVAPVNDAPIAVNDGPVVLVEDANVIFDPITGSDTDVENDPLNIVSINGQAISPTGSVTTPEGRIDLALDGRTLVFTPIADFAGPTTVTYGVSDGQDVAEAEIIFDVTPVDDPLTVIGSPVGVAFQDGEIVNLPLATFINDPDGDALLFSATGLPNGLTINASSGIISGVVASDASQFGPYSVSVTVGDGVASTETINFDISVENTTPVAAAAQTLTLGEGKTFTYDVRPLFSDADGDVLTYSASGLPSWATFDTVTGLISGTVPADAAFFGTVPVTLSVDDSEGGTAAAVLSLEPVNEVPIFTNPIADVSVREGETVSINIGGAFSDGGEDSDSLTVSIFGLPSGLTLDTSTMTLAGTVSASAGDYFIAVSVADNQGASVQEIFEIKVLAVTDPSTPVGDGTNTFFEAEEDEDEFEPVSFADLVDDEFQPAFSNELVLGVGSVINEFGNLNPTQVLDGENGVLGTAISAIDPLYNSTPSGSDGGLPDQIANMSEMAQATDWLNGSGRPGNGDWNAGEFNGFTSLWEEKSERDFTGRDNRLDRFTLDVISRQGVLFIEFKNTLDIMRDGTVVRTVLTMADGSPMPEWMKLVREGFIRAQPPELESDFVLKVAVTLGNGNELTKLVRVNAANGDIAEVKPSEFKAMEQVKKVLGDKAEADKPLPREVKSAPEQNEATVKQSQDA